MKIDEPLVILGGGINGIFTALEASKYFENVFLIEENSLLGEGQTNHSSGIAHTGVNYKGARLKTKFCIEGNELLTQYCTEYNKKNPGAINFRRNGKLIVARTRRETDLLAETKEHADSIGVPAKQLSLEQIKCKEPFVAVKRDYAPDDAPGVRAALFMPTAGIFDTGDVMRAARSDAEAAKVSIYTNTKIESVKPTPEGFKIATNRHREPLEARLVVNALGLGAHVVAEQCGIKGYALRPTRGEYAVIKKMLLNEPIYVVKDPESSFQGAHLMRTADKGKGECVFGPNAKTLNTIDYNNELDLDGTLQCIRTLIPRVERNDLILGHTGVRSMLELNETPVKDFVLYEQICEAGWMTHLLNFHSPGFTSALATAKYVVHKSLCYMN